MMSAGNKQIKVLLLDLRILMDSCREDIDNEIWGNWPQYVKEFNRLRKNEAISKYTEITAIEYVRRKGILSSAAHGFGSGTPEEIAKIREVENQTKRIIQRLELDYPKESKQILYDDFNIALQLIFRKFHKVVLQLRNRRENRNTININDEYDVQDLLHALLRIFFTDIRTEEWTPSYAGKASRMDYLLKKEQVVIEVKKTRRGLKDREIGEQLIVDIEHYKKHPDCKILYCFIYDPENKIVNPIGIENDLSREADDLVVRVIVSPRIE